MNDVKELNMNLNILKLAKDFATLLNDELSSENLAKVIALNAAETNTEICHSHDFCDPNQVMIDAMALQNVELDTQSEEQRVQMNLAWDIAKKARFDSSGITFLSVGCVTIGVQRSDGDIRLLTTINNNDDELSAEAFAQQIDQTVNVYQMLDIDAQVYLRQDSPDYFDPDVQAVPKEEGKSRSVLSALEPTCISIGSKQADGSIRLLGTLNNNYGELGKEALFGAIDALMNVFQSNGVETKFYLRQDSENHIDLDEGEAVAVADEDVKVVSHA